ncbi:MAG: NYN domain-containing protein [Candidatus Nomurabacteria bacterium]|nr:NYN domain-containing protein [Candidatus Nomurabacteria bacterium]
MTPERVIIYIDGGNTYKALFKETKNRKDGSIVPKIVPKGKIFNYKEFASLLASNRNLCGKKYYVGIVRNFDDTKKSSDMVTNQQKFLAKIENEGFAIERGKIVYDHQIREKGVDVKIAIDLVIDGIEDKYDIAIVVSSDTDLIPAIKYVQSKGKRVEYIGFSNSTSVGLIKDCDYQRVFGSTDLQQFIF